MDNSVKIETFNLNSVEGPLQISAYVPIDETPISFEAACDSLRGDWDSKDLGYKIRAARAIAAEVPKACNLKFVAPLFVSADNDLGPAAAVYMPTYGISIFSPKTLASADSVSNSVPHEYFHSCQYELGRIISDNPTLASKDQKIKFTEWFGTKSISVYGEDTLGYLSQPLEHDAFEYAYNFTKQYNLPFKGASADFAAVLSAKDPETHEIVADPKMHLQKLASFPLDANTHLGAFLPGGHTSSRYAIGNVICRGIQGIRKDILLHEKPSLSNIIAHLTYKLAPKKVFLTLPNPDIDKAFNGKLTLIYGDEVYVHPRYVFDSMTPRDLVSPPSVNRTPTSSILSSIRQSQSRVASRQPNTSPQKGGPGIG